MKAISHIPYQNKLKIVLVLFVITIFCGTNLLAQEKYRIKFNLIIDEGNTAGSKVSAERDGQKWKSIDGDDGKSYIDLDYQHDYIISFSKPGYITKKIAISTKVPKKSLQGGFDPFVCDVTLFKQYDGVNIVIFNQPVAKVEFRTDIDDFDFDTDYTKTVLSGIQAAEEELNKKKIEEKKNPKPVVAINNANNIAENTTSKANEGAPQSNETINNNKSELEPNKSTETITKTKNESNGNLPIVEGENKPNKTNGIGENETRGEINAKVENDPKTTNTAKIVEGADTKNTIKGKTESETATNTNSNNNSPTNRKEESYKEGNKQIKVVTIEKNGRIKVYKRVVAPYGTAYFCDGVSITAAIYNQEAE